MREFEIAADTVEVVFSSDRAIHRPWGLWGGSEGTLGRVVAIQDGKSTQLPANGAALTMHRGDRLRVETGGGGGFGDPAERTHEAIARDLREGRITPAFAREAYGDAAVAEGEKC